MYIKSLNGMTIFFCLNIDGFIFAFTQYALWRKERKKEYVTFEKCKQCLSICKLFAQFVYTLRYIQDVQNVKSDVQYVLYSVKSIYLLQLKKYEIICNCLQQKKTLFLGIKNRAATLCLR